MSVLDAILLGFVQGVTSFLPVSSSGHVVIFEQLLKIESNDSAFLTAMLNIGTLIAMVLAFRADLIKILTDTIEIIQDIWKNFRIFIKNITGKQDDVYIKLLSNHYRKFAGLVYISIIPTALFGCFVKRILPETTPLILVGLNLLITGILLLVVDFVKPGTKQPKDASLLSGMIIGACQGIAALPGISRYGFTLSAGILCGYNRKFAVRYSFIMSIPAIIGALIIEIRDSIANPAIDMGFVLYSIVGAIVACIVGLFCIRIMFRLVQKKRLRYFSFYCFIIGIVAIAGNFLL